MSMLPGEIGDTTVQQFTVPEVWTQNFPSGRNVGGKLSNAQKKRMDNLFNAFINSDGTTQITSTLPKGQTSVLRNRFGLAADLPLNSWSIDQIMPAIQKYYGNEYANAIQQRMAALNQQRAFNEGRNWEGFVNQQQQHNWSPDVQNALANTYANAGQVPTPNLSPTPSLWGQLGAGQQVTPVNVPVLQAAGGKK